MELSPVLVNICAKCNSIAFDLEFGDLSFGNDLVDARCVRAPRFKARKSVLFPIENLPIGACSSHPLRFTDGWPLGPSVSWDYWSFQPLAVRCFRAAFPRM